MTSLAHVHARHDGTGTLTIGQRTETVTADDLTAVLEQLLALVVAEAKLLGRPIGVVAQLEGSPRTGLTVEPSGAVTEDPKVLARSLARSSPDSAPARKRRSPRTAAASTTAPSTATSGSRPAPSPATPGRDHRRTVIAGAGIAALTLVVATGAWAAVNRSEDPPSTTPSTAATVAPTTTPTVPSTKPARSAPAPVAKVRLLAVGSRETIRFIGAADKKLSVRVRLTPPGKGKPAQFRSLRLVPRVSTVFTMRGLRAGVWRWVVVVADSDPATKPIRGKVTVTRTPPAPSAKTTTPTPATTPTTAPPPAPVVPTQTAQPTQQPAPQPTQQPTRPAPVKPTRGPVKPTGGPVKPDNGPEKP